MSTSINLSGRTAVVTAAAGAGVGFAIARSLRDAGATVSISDAHAGRLARARDELGIDGAVVDVSDTGALSSHLDQVAERHGPIDVLVSAAGINQVAPAWELTMDEWRAVLEVNLTAPFAAARAVLPAMVARGSGSIIHIASIAAWAPSPGEAAYQASKAGLLGLTRALALDAAPHGVRANAIAPGLVENPFLANVYGAERVRALREQIPMGRGAEPDEIGAAACWLASDASAYVTGECLTVAGGWHMRP